MGQTKVRYFLSLILISSLFFTHFQSANAVERKKTSWLASCPDVVDATPQLPTPKTIFLRSPSGQTFKLLVKDSTEFVTEPQSILGCYVYEEFVVNPATSPNWQIGALNRDSQGYYFKNQAGITWRLTLNMQSLILETEPGSPNYSKGSGFRLDADFVIPKDCKVIDYFRNGLSLGFPRDSARVPSKGETKNLILVVDFPDALLTESMNSVVEDIVAPSRVEDFFYKSSNGRFKPVFTIFPKVITLSSFEKSFAQNTSGGFFRDGIQQDQRLILEAVKIARTQGSLEGYASINLLIPTAKSMGYYGGAHINLPINVGNQTVLNSQMVGGTVGTILSPVPSWKVFAHEYGHLLGMYDLYIQGTGSSGKSPGPFDLMGNTSGKANSFFGFQRWVQGWIEDSEVVCDLEPNSSVTHTLTPLNQNSGKKLYVHPLDGTKALVVEFRAESEYDVLEGNDGLLVYLVDMKVGTLKGPVSIQHSEQDLALNPRDDLERYSRAPLSSGQTVKIGDLVIVAGDVSRERATFKVISSLEYQAKQISEAKAAAELKAKQEAEAKAAADKAALAKAQSELVAANAALADAQKLNRELQTQLNSVEAQFKILSDSVSLIQSQVSQLNSKLAAALTGQNALNAKLKKICAAKPKPKGC